MRALIIALGATTSLTLATPLAAQSRPDGSMVAPSTAQNSMVRPILFAPNAKPEGVLVIPTASGTLPPISGVTLSNSDRAAIENAMRSAKFEGKAGSNLSLRGIGPFAQILIVGVAGEANSEAQMRDAGGRAAQALREENVGVIFAGTSGAADAAAVAQGYALGQYRFDRYKTVGKSMPPMQPVTILTNNAKAADALWTGTGKPLVEGVTLSRDLSAEPANVLYPEIFVDRVRAAFGNTAGVKITILDEGDMAKMGMGSILGVGQGSRRPSRMMIVEYKGAKSGAPLALVGKGITFDSGGTSIKPALGMWEMKSDMSGAASVMGAVLSLAKSKAQVNVIGVAALAENMPGGNAQRPGDVVRTMSGKTIEVLNTDAEGRLVMADATEYVVATHKPSGVITMATLTGSIVQALDDEYAGLFARDERLANMLSTAGQTTGENLWRMPIHKNYAEDMKSDIADIKNVVEGGRPGAGLAAHFVGYFVDPATPFAHIDIAGVNWNDKADAITPKGASGYGVRLLDATARGWGK
jgi:leucyl aminopeptidase